LHQSKGPSGGKRGLDLKGFGEGLLTKNMKRGALEEGYSGGRSSTSKEVHSPPDEDIRRRLESREHEKGGKRKVGKQD